MKDFFNNLSANLKIALIVSVLVVLWMLSGGLRGSGNTEISDVKEEPSQSIKVITKKLQPQNFARKISLVGISEPLTDVTLVAQTAGKISGIKIKRGDLVTKGQKLLTIEMSNRQATLIAAKARLESALVLVKAARNLFKEGFMSESKLAEREATLATAKKDLASIKQDIIYTTVTSPINGIIEDRMVDVGDYAGIGAPLFQIIARDEFLIVGNIAQQDREKITLGQLTTATLANGQNVVGKLKFIATNADANTKTYRVEILIDGKEFQIPTGMTATLELQTGAVEAYLIPHSLLILSDSGNIGVMLANDGAAKFIEVITLEDTPEGLWVSGLPDTGVNIITRGQNSVSDGSLIDER